MPTRSACSRRLLPSGRMHHGWLLTGAGGIGKANALPIASRGMCCRRRKIATFSGIVLAVPENAPAPRQIQAQAHPGFSCSGGRTHQGQAFRDHPSHRRGAPVEAFLGLTGGEGQWRCGDRRYGGRSSTSMPPTRLLKSLRSHRRGHSSSLISSRPGRLLPTIRSRCRRLDLKALEPTDLKRAAEAALFWAKKDAPRRTLANA